ncbi:acyl-CoA thioesterase-1 [Flavobacteriaceae bacterium MAR_2010_72]|nr:acyl-CoA thioesterase-1 [Flavobacteriaceae bacterium MAR_2010_72]TVZ57642.1 acyl-CoA thioesterase-1 [Flavobacteriaceae bacterium MAR_2010_105]
MILKQIPIQYYRLLMFCYILLFIASCGGNASKKAKETTSEKETVETKASDSTKVILFFGNSLTAGMGLDPSDAFPAIIQTKIDSLGLPYETINAGLSGETTAAGKSRISWVLNQPIDIFVLELGANDGLRGVPLSETRSNLQSIIDYVKEKDSTTKIILAGMQMPPNLGPSYTEEFKSIFPELAEKNDTYLIPFLLNNVAGIPELNQNDGIHPTVEGQQILADNVWKVLEPLLEN